MQFLQNEQQQVLSDAMPTSPTLGTDAAGKYIGEIFGKPLSSPVKPLQCREKTCKKKAVYTHEDEEDNSVPILCEQHRKNLLGC